MRIVTNDGLVVGAISWSYMLTGGTACQRMIYNIFLEEGLFCIFARLVRLQTN